MVPQEPLGLLGGRLTLENRVLAIFRSGRTTDRVCVQDAAHLQSVRLDALVSPVAGTHLTLPRGSPPPLCGLMQLEQEQDPTHNCVQVDSEQSTGTRIRLPVSYNASQLLSWQYLPAPSFGGMNNCRFLGVKVICKQCIGCTAYRKGDV